MTNCISSVFKNNFIAKTLSKPKLKTGLIVLVKVIATFGCSYKYSEKTRQQWAFAFKNKQVHQVKTPKNQKGKATPPAHTKLDLKESLVSSIQGFPVQSRAISFEDDLEIEHRKLAKSFFADNSYSDSYFEEALAKTSQLVHDLFKHRKYLHWDGSPEELFRSTLASYMELKTANLDGHDYLQKIQPGSSTKALFGSKLYLTQIEGKTTYIAKLALIGQGSSNRVYFSVDILNGRVCAMRELIIQDEIEQSILAKEAALHQQIASMDELRGKVIKLWAIFQNVLILSLANKGSLSSALRRKLINNSQKKDILMQIMTFMRDFHDYGFVYGDLKSDNILMHVPSPGVIDVYFGDFGGSYGADQKPKNAITLSYMAPELFLNGQPDQFTDLWILGLIMYEMKYRQDPSESATDLVPEFINSALKKYRRFQHEDTGKIASGIIEHALAAPEEYFDVADPYNIIMLGLLKFNPEDRISLDEALEQLQNTPLECFS